MNLTFLVRIFTIICAIILNFGCMFKADIQPVLETESSNSNLKKVYFTVLNATLTEGSFGLFNIAMESAQESDVVLELSLVGPSGRFQSLPATVTIPKGSLTTSFLLQSIDDNIFEDTVHFSVEMSTQNSGVGISVGKMNIDLVDDEPPTSSLYCRCRGK